MFAAFALLRDAALLLLRGSRWVGRARDALPRSLACSSSRSFPAARLLPSGGFERHSDIAPRFFAEFAVSTGVSKLTVFAIGGIAGLGELGRLRAGEIVLGPLNVLFAGVGLVATAEGVRLLHESPRRLVHGCRWLSLALAAGVLAWGVVLLSRTPQYRRVGVASELGRRAIVGAAPSDCALIGYASSFGASIGLHCLAAARRSLRARCIDGVLTFFFGLAGAYLAGAKGVAWGFARGRVVEERQRVVAILEGPP